MKKIVDLDYAITCADQSCFFSEQTKKEKCRLAGKTRHFVVQLLIFSFVNKHSIVLPSKCDSIDSGDSTIRFNSILVSFPILYQYIPPPKYVQF